MAPKNNVSFSKNFDDAVKDFFEVLSLCMNDKTFFIGRTTDTTFSVLRISDNNVHPFQEGMTVDMENSLCSHMYWDSRKPLVIEDTSTYPIASQRRTAELTKIRSYLGAPILLKDGSMFGSLCAVDNKISRFSPEDIMVIERIAKFLSYVIELENLSLFDSLTGVYNRRYLYSYFEKERLSTNQLSALLFFDLDNFKCINDTYGHEAGDFVLKEVSQRIKDSLPDNGFVSRIGGDEFIVHLTGFLDKREMETCARHILDQILNPFPLPGQSLSLSACIGISVYTKAEKDIEVLIKQSDMALYRAKQNGKNTFCFCE